MNKKNLPSPDVDKPENKSKKPKKDNKPKKDKISENKDETLHFLLGQKLIYLNTIAKVCMSWWVSSIVFCGTILAAVWLRRGELVDSGIINYLGFFVGCFFLSFIGFGIAALYYLFKFRDKISELIAPPNSSQTQTDSKQISADAFNIEIHSIMCGILIGIVTFILILIVWIILFVSLYQGCCKVFQ
ncbi:MAG TPA: hypothetical protein VGC76_12495 [Pyrinomonadaceae bacterium]|jgi:hypothetical protein